ncbi:MAG: DUF6600 domain-containing protein, partial [Polaromonas sp.]
ALPLNWAPYRMGHWSWIAPWGWTWIDDAPWGFAPFHYGRWAQIGARWCWVPGRLAARPVYAPALVVFVGGSSGGVHWNIAIGSGGLARPAVGWFPLAPGEAFRPAYRVSPRYVTQVNQNIVVNNTVNVTNLYRYQRQPDAVTAVSKDDFARGRPAHGNRHTLGAADLSRAQVVAEPSAMPQRPDQRERPRPVEAAALPPAAVVARPVVGSRDERRDNRRGESREARQQDRTDDRRDEQRAGRPDDNDRNARAQAPMPAAPVTATPPALHPIPAPAQDRGAIDTEQRARREQLQLQREQERQLREQTRQQLQHDQQRRQGEESLGQRALREQAQKNAGSAPMVNPDARATAERNSALQAEQAQRAQQQLQRDQQRQQRELIHQQEQQRRQSEEALGQRALREQAQKQQEQARQQQALQQQQQQHRAQQEQQRQAGEQQQLQRDQQRQQRELIHQQEQQRRQNEESLGQRALREQAQKQQEQARQQQALQQQQQRAQQEQQRQAREQQQEQRKEQAQERRQKRL